MSIRNTRYIRADLVSEKGSDGDVVFLNHDKGTLITISKTGIELLSLFDIPRSCDQVATMLGKKYLNITSCEVEESVAEMLKSGLIRKWTK